jgi:hypothetical protein
MISTSRNGRMRYLILTVLFLVLQPASYVAQKRSRGPACPSIKVECPEHVDPGNMMVCSAFISGLDDVSGLKFSWTVSRGVITKGKDSDSIVVDPTREYPGVILATVEVKGLPRSCAKTASSHSMFYVRESSSTKIEEYGDVVLEVEQNYLDLLAQRLRDDPGAMPWIIAYAGRAAYENEAIERAEQAKRYLVEKHGIEPRRVVVVDGGFREVRSVELWLAEQGALNDPFATPTLKRDQVQIQKGKRTPK